MGAGLPGTRVLEMRFTIPPYAAAAKGTSVQSRVDDAPARTHCCYGPGEHELRLTLDPEIRGPTLRLRLHATPSFVPAERGIGSDRRHLTLLLRSVVLLEGRGARLGLGGRGGTSVLNLIVVMLGGVATAVAARRRPAFAWLAMLVSDPFAFTTDLGMTTVTLPKLVLLGACAGLATRADARTACTDVGAARWILVPFAGFVASMLLSGAAADDRGAALRETLKTCWSTASAFVVAFVAYSGWTATSRCCAEPSPARR